MHKIRMTDIFMFVANDVNACEFMLCFITEFICGQDF